ncbi:MAG: hypothetical protein ACYCUX_07755, partial [Metallibacterium sp.]
MEPQAYGRIAPEIRPDGLKKEEKRSTEQKYAPKLAFLHPMRAFFFPEVFSGCHFEVKSDRLL